MKGPEFARKLVVIPDAHAHPQYDNDRFEWLGRWISAQKPDVVLCLGDFADMPALSAYDRGKRGFEGRRYVRDVEAVHDALGRLHGAITGSPELYMCLGNHEARIDRATSDASELEGTIAVEDLGYRERGWNVVPYTSQVTIGGFACSHHFASGVAGRPIGGMTAAATMTRLLYQSAIVGHSHTVDWARRTRPDGTRVNAIVAGCYTHPAQGEESWCKATAHLWWRGALVLEDVRGGDFGAMHWSTMDSIKPGPAPEPQMELDWDDNEEPTHKAGIHAVAEVHGVKPSSVARWMQRGGGARRLEDYAPRSKKK